MEERDNREDEQPMESMRKTPQKVRVECCNGHVRGGPHREFADLSRVHHLPARKRPRRHGECRCDELLAFEK